MNIGILITSINNFGQKGFYNAQEVGLAKALSPKADSVLIFKLVTAEEPKWIENVKGYPNVKIYFLPSKNIGINGILHVENLVKRLNVLIHFSDTQLSVPTAYRWCKTNHIQYIPYIGVIESHSASTIKRWITNCIFKRNLSLYKKCICCVKTPAVEKKMKKLGVTNTVVTPVGLDTDLLKMDYDRYDPFELKNKYGYHREDKVLLFIGRLIEEKQPIRMIDIFSEVRKKSQSYKLLIVGTGGLKDIAEERIQKLHLENYVKIIDRIPNDCIWELYRFADAFVNLNQHEIFGMAILEAMYYRCKVIAWEAPGPNYIIEDGQSGWLVKSNKEVIDRIMDTRETGVMANMRIVNSFTWKRSAERICAIIGEKDEY